MASEMEGAPRMEDPRRTEMKAPDEVAAMIKLKELGWGRSGLRPIEKQIRRVSGYFGRSLLPTSDNGIELGVPHEEEAIRQAQPCRTKHGPAGGRRRRLGADEAGGHAGVVDAPGAFDRIVAGKFSLYTLLMFC